MQNSKVCLDQLWFSFSCQVLGRHFQVLWEHRPNRQLHAPMRVGAKILKFNSDQKSTKNKIWLWCYVERLLWKLKEKSEVSNMDSLDSSTVLMLEGSRSKSEQMMRRNLKETWMTWGLAVFKRAQRLTEAYFQQLCCTYIACPPTSLLGHGPDKDDKVASW